MRFRTLAVAGLALAVSIPAPRAAPPEPPADKPAEVEPSDYHAPDPNPVPPGAKADQELWKRAMDDSNAIGVSRATAAKLQWKARQGNYGARLAELAKGQPAADAERTKELAARLQLAWAENNELLNSRWPVDPTRGCQYPAQLLESTMQSPEGPERAAALVPARADATRCVEAAEAILSRMGGSSARLEKALAEADAALAPAKAAGK
ncbi:MAG TPA: hypothetical protein VFM45_08430 [Anaeromyxobacteraceae bacterium]|nr:hypothetical protein [Anaeromyxobacteraceae bacterium]